MSLPMTAEEARKQNGSYGLPVWVLETPEVGASAKFVYLLVEARPGLTPEEYAEWQSVTPEAVRAGLNDLWNAKIITVKDGRPYPYEPVLRLDVQ